MADNIQERYDQAVKGLMASAVNTNTVPEAIMAMIKGIAKLSLFYREKRKEAVAKTAQTIVDLSEAYNNDLHSGP